MYHCKGHAFLAASRRVAFSRVEGRYLEPEDLREQQLERGNPCFDPRMQAISAAECVLQQCESELAHAESALAEVLRAQEKKPSRFARLRRFLLREPKKIEQCGLVLVAEMRVAELRRHVQQQRAVVAELVEGMMKYLEQLYLGRQFGYSARKKPTGAFPDSHYWPKVKRHC